MDLEKVKSAYHLYARMDDLKSSILTLRSRMEKGPGTTTITIPTTWLPAIISIAEKELEKVNKEIENL